VPAAELRAKAPLSQKQAHVIQALLLLLLRQRNDDDDDDDERLARE